MNNTTLILLGAGSSSRFKALTKKQWIYCDNKPLWFEVAQFFEQSASFEKIVIVSSKEEIEYMRYFASYNFVIGGDTRQESLSNALKEVNSDFVLVSDIARSCVPKEIIKRVLETKADCVVPTLKAIDTLYFNNSPINRDEVKIIQTPQLSNTELLKEALKQKEVFTDESSAIASIGGNVVFVKGDNKSHKLTTIEDLKKLTCLKAPSNETFVGIGIDIHSFEDNKKMFLCGVKLDENYGFKAHSDGDVAIHSIIDALLGASGLGDIGEWFPDTDNKYKEIDSKILLKDTLKRVRAFGFELINVDITIIAQVPKLTPYKSKMRSSLSTLLDLPQNRVNIKATTNEKMGFIGRKEGVAVHSIVNLKYFDWTKV